VPPQAPVFSDGLAWAATANVLVPRPDEVTAYLNQHPDLARLLPEICAQVRQAFGQAAELSLALYRDPEVDDRYLTLYVRQDPYGAGILEQIEAVSSRFHDSLAAVSGHLLISTDLLQRALDDPVE